MKNKISEDTNVTLDLKTIGIIIGGVVAIATTYFTLQSSVASNTEDIQAINNNTVNPIEWDYKDKLIRSSIEKIESDVMTVKEDLQDFAGIDLIQQMKVYDYKWIDYESRSYGVLAHELQEVLPGAVSGEKDDEEMQGVDYSKVVPVLIKAIQELKAEIELLKK